MISTNSFFKRLSVCLILKAFLMLSLILVAGIGLSPDEAQYWTWSRKLDWGYYSKPPGIAWQIWLGTQLFGQTELGVRVLSVVLAMAQAFAVYFLAIQSGLQARTAFWSGCLMAFSPIGIMGSFLAITDGGFLLFWTFASVVMVNALHHKKEANPFLIGACLLGGALFKWPIYAFWIIFLLCRHWWFSTQPLYKFFLGICLSLIGLLPSILWNASHNWVTFRHVFSTLQGGHGAQRGNFFEFIGSQIALISPLLFLLLMSSLIAWIKQRQRLSPALFFCGFVSLTCLIFAIFVSLFQKIQGNWIVFVYPTSFVLLAWFVCEKNIVKIIWLKLGLVLSISLTLFVFGLPWLYQTSIWRPAFLSYRINPFKHNSGWNSLKEALTAYGYNSQKDFLLSDKYQTTSILSFYNEGQKRAYFLNLQGARNNQFSYWPSLGDEQKGKSGYFIWVENSPYLMRDRQEKQIFYQQALSPYFEKVKFLDLIPLLYDQQKIVKGALLFKCENCLGSQPQESILY